MTTLEIILFCSGLTITIFLFVRWSGRGVDRKQEKLFDEKTSPDAQARGCCMVRETYYEMPGVAQILDGKLFICTVLGDVIQIPMAQVKLLKMRKNKYLLGRYPWWGKTALWLETPKTSGLVLGVDDPEPWQRVFTGSHKSSNLP